MPKKKKIYWDKNNAYLNKLKAKTVLTTQEQRQLKFLQGINQCKKLFQ